MGWDSKKGNRINCFFFLFFIFFFFLSFQHTYNVYVVCVRGRLATISQITSIFNSIAVLHTYTNVYLYFTTHTRLKDNRYYQPAKVRAKCVDTIVQKCCDNFLAPIVNWLNNDFLLDFIYSTGRKRKWNYSMENYTDDMTKN